MEEKWTVYGKRADFQGIGEKFGIDQVIARVIRNRDIESDEDINLYLNGNLRDVLPYNTLRDIQKGCQIIKDSIDKGEHIRIVSDYDVDGITSNYILYKGLTELGGHISYEIPDRIRDGYGVNERIIQDAYKDGVSTIITCDNGVSAFDAIDLAKSYGMKVVVTDHHEIPGALDEEGNKVYRYVNADALIDIKHPECSYKNKNLCGAGVAYKFIRNLFDLCNVPWEDEKKFIDILAIATVCDVMELRDENRIYVKEGLKVLKETTNLGLKTLIKYYDLEGKNLTSYHLGFLIGPSINSTGRLDSAKKGLDLLLSEDVVVAESLATEMVTLNSARKTMTESGVDKAKEEVNIQCVSTKFSGQDDLDKVLVIYLPELHESIAGIVAGRIKEHFYRPVFIITDAEGKEGIVKGSGRSIDGYNMADALMECQELLVGYGGHEKAAGVSLNKDNLNAFRVALNKNCKLTEEELTPVLRIDVPMPISYISPDIVSGLNKLEPFGNGNTKPIFAQAGLGVKSARYMGKENQFIKFVFQDDQGYTIEGIDFNAKHIIDCIKMWFSDEECDKMLKGLPNNIKLDVAYYPGVNEYMGRQTLQIQPSKYRKSQ